MKKGQKVKRYGNIYSNGARKSKRRKALLGVLCVAVLAVAGWLIYPPVRDFLLNDDYYGEEESSSSSLTDILNRSEVGSVSDKEEISGSTGAESLPEASEPEVIVPAVTEVKGIYLPASAAVDRAAFSTGLENASAHGVNTVLVESKDSGGTVYFSSENEVAAKAKAVSDTPFDAAETAKAIHEKGMRASAVVYAFRDPLVSRNVKSMAVTYGNSETRWLDNSADLGGKSWLNPCSEEAQDYIISLAVELTKAGFDDIVLEGVQFPSGVGLDKAGYGLIGSFSRRDILRDFVADITSAVEGVGGRVTVGIPAESIETADSPRNLTKANSNIYGGSPEFIVIKNGILILSEGADIDAAVASAKAGNPDAEWTLLISGADNAVQIPGDAAGYYMYEPSGTYTFS